MTAQGAGPRRPGNGVGVAMATEALSVAMETAPPAMLGQARRQGSHRPWEINGFLLTNTVSLSSFPSECSQCFLGCPL